MNRDYGIAKLHGAAHTLMTHPGELSERVQKAQNDLIKFSMNEEFDSCSEPIRGLLAKVSKGDWSKVRKTDYQRVAETVYELSMWFR